MLNQLAKETQIQTPHRLLYSLKQMKERPQRMGGQLGILAAFAAVYLIWGSTFLAIHFAIDTIPPFLMAGFRFLAAGTILYVLARMTGAPRPKPVHWRTAFITGGLMLLSGNGMIGWAEQSVSSGMAGLLVATVPLWAVVIGAVLDRQRPSLSVMGGLGLGLMGVILLVGPGNMTGGDSKTFLGIMVILAACFSWALGTHYSRRARQPDSQNMATALSMLAGGFLLVVFGAINGEHTGFDVGAVTLKSGLAVAYLVLFGSVIGFSAYMWLVRVTTPARASSNFYVNPAVAVFLGWLLAGETITAQTLIATVVIVSGVVLIVSQKKPSQ